MRKTPFRWSLLASALTTATFAHAADFPFPPLENQPAVKAPLPWELEFGARYWYSTGYYRGDLFDAEETARKISRLTYANLDAHSAESFFRFEHETGFFLKGYLGGGSIVGGHLTDEDYPPHVHEEDGTLAPYSKTIQSQSGGSLQYGAIDAGFNILRTPEYRLGPFVGYHYFRERINTFGCVQIGADPGTCGKNPEPTTIDGLDEDARWYSLRLGLSGRVVILPGLNFDAEVAWAHNWLKGTDYHNSRPKIWGARDDGNGDGFQAEALLSYDLTPQLSVGVGGRYWYFDSGSGKTHWERTPGGGAAAPQRAVSERYGMFLQTAYRFGGTGAPASPFGEAAAPRSALGARDWAGLYIGPNVGYGMGGDAFSFTPTSESAVSFAGAGNMPASQSFPSVGFLGGGQIGYNYPVSASALVGVETDIDYAHVGGSFGYTYLDFNVSSAQRTEWLGTTRLRLGWLPGAGSLLLYATGGLAYGGVSASAAMIGGPHYMVGENSSASVGWSAGAGAELAVAANVSLKAEYLYVDLGPRSFVMYDYGVSPAGETPLAYALQTRAQHNLVRLGVNYKFDLPGLAAAPIAAAY